MIASEDLFHLIRSMSQSEKRYFKIVTSQHTIGDKNDYVKLFDAIDRQNKYDEKSLEIHSGGSTFTTNFPVIKSYLYKMILKSMRQYKIDSSIEITISGLIQDAAYLSEKLLYKQAYKILQRAKKMGYKYEKFADIFKILKMEHALVNQLALAGDLLEHYKRIEKEKLEVLELLKNIHKYEKSAHRIYAYITKKGPSRNNSDRQRIKKSVDVSVFTNEKDAHTYTAKKFYNHAAALFYKAMSDNQKSLKYQAQLTNLFDLYPEQKEDDIASYITTLHNVLILCDEMNKTTDFFIYLEKLKNINTSNRLLQARIFESYYGLLLSFYILRKNFNTALKLVPAITDGYKKYDGKLNKLHQLSAAFNLACLYFYTQQFNKSLYWLNSILNDQHLNIRDNVYGFSCILNLLIHYELRNMEVVANFLKSTHRFLGKTEQLYKTEQYVIDFIKDVLKTINKSDEKTLLKKLKHNILSMDDPMEKQALEYFDFIYWIDKKIK
jgi:hypothetical protein